MGSYEAIKLSTDSLEVSLQDSNIFLNFRDDFRFLWPPASTLLLQLSLLGKSLTRAKTSLSCIKSVDAGAHKNRKSSQKFKIMLESCKETSKLSADSFMVS